MKIKTIGTYYSTERIVINNVPDIEYAWVKNYANPFLKILKRFEVWKPLFDNDVDGYHTVNTVMLTPKPWVCSFEDYCPRGEVKDFWDIAYWGKPIPISKRIINLLERLALPNCKRLIAWSERNLKMQQLMYERINRPEITDKLFEKTCTIKVPQRLLVQSPNPNGGGKIKFCFVGNDFSRKGGWEIVRAMRELRKQRNDFELYMVSIFDHKHAGRWHTDEELEQLIDYISSQDWIHVQSRLANKDALNLMKSCHVGLLPTWFDTYGFSVLEMQGCGLPVITTNVRALPEINPKGWVVDMPVTWNSEIDLLLQYKLSHLMEKKLFDIFKDILEHKEVIMEKAWDSLNYIKECHSVEGYSSQLSQIYAEFNK